MNTLFLILFFFSITFPVVIENCTYILKKTKHLLGRNIFLEAEIKTIKVWFIFANANVTNEVTFENQIEKEIEVQ